jgi:pimeloyl-ACP methyl ester carboxylesterase
MSEQKQIIINEKKLNYLQAGEKTGKPILMLHGMKFNSTTWEETGILTKLGEKGFNVIAVDLPGFGESHAMDLEKGATLKLIIEKLKLVKPIIIAPSMSGGYVLPVVAADEDILSGLVAVAPTNIPDYAEQIKGKTLPVLAVWGDNDEIVPPENADILCRNLSDCSKVIIENGGHPTYINETDSFLENVLVFLKQF